MFEVAAQIPGRGEHLLETDRLSVNTRMTSTPAVASADKRASSTRASEVVPRPGPPVGSDQLAFQLIRDDWVALHVEKAPLRAVLLVLQFAVWVRLRYALIPR